MSKKNELESSILDLYKAIQEKKRILRNTDSARTRQKAGSEIAKQEPHTLKKFLNEYTKEIMPSDIYEISAKLSKSAVTRSNILLFDIDGTVLEPQDSLEEGIGFEFLTKLKELAKRGFYFVFITGNDFEIQKRRILDPIIQSGLGPYVFCFSDGGSRAFDFNPNDNGFQEIKNYSDKNVMTPEHEAIKKAFQVARNTFLHQPENDPLRRPHILWHERTLDYLDIRIFPLRPSFIRSSDYEKFCDEILSLSKHVDIGSTVFRLIKTYAGSLIIRALSRNPDTDANLLQNSIVRNLMYRKEYRELSLPEIEERGGSVTCQIALKPFNDNVKRMQFRDIIEKELATHDVKRFSVLLGGRTTIDIQRQGVNKEMAVKFLINDKGLNSQDMIYFGNEFNKFGNDRAVAEMKKDRPGFIVNVGRPLNESEKLPGVVIEDGNGPTGTLNYLEFLLHKISFLEVEDQRDLPTKIAKYFTISELQDLCYRLDIDYEDLPGRTISVKARELVMYGIRHGITNSLLGQLQKLRPNDEWIE